jgi:hypothetical protein
MLKSVTYMHLTEGMLFAAEYQLRALVKLISHKIVNSRLSPSKLWYIKGMWYWVWFATNPRVWWGLLDILWAWPIKYLMNQVNSTVWLMPIKWFSTVWVFNWRLTQLKWLICGRLPWEVEKKIDECHTRACVLSLAGLGCGCGRGEAR